MASDKNKLKLDPCNGVEFIQKLRDLGELVSNQVVQLDQAVRQEVSEALTINQIWNTQEITQFNQPIQAAALATPADTEIVKAINQLDRPARARGLTVPKLTFLENVQIGDTILAPNPMRRMFALCGIGHNLIAPFAQPAAGYLDFGTNATMKDTPTHFIEETWGVWIQLQWWYAGPGMANQLAILEEIYVQ